MRATVTPMPLKRAKRLGKPTLHGAAKDRVQALANRLHEELFDENQTRMAETFRVSQPTVSGWLSGTSAPSLAHLRRMARLAHMRFEDLIADADVLEADAFVNLQTAILYGPPGSDAGWPTHAVDAARRLAQEGERHTPQQWTRVLRRLSGA